MSMTKRMIEDQHEDTEMLDADYQYFQWLNDKEWQEYLDDMEKQLHKKYGYGATYILKYAEFINKNK